MIGEYVGNQDYQHLVKYQKMTILFYAMVENTSEDICLPVTHTMNFLNKFNLDKVSYTNEGTFNTYDDLCDKIETLYK